MCHAHLIRDVAALHALELSGVQTRLMINLDLSGMGLSLSR
jgi:hypothetical protein